MNRKFFIITLIVVAWIAFSCGSKQVIADDTFIIEVQQQPEPEEEPSGPTRAELVMKALHAAYPREISAVEFRDDDWAVLMHDVWYYYAEGRLLHEDIRENVGNYRSQSFYRYSVELAPFAVRPIPEPRTGNNNNNNNNNNAAQQRVVLSRSSFLDDLWRARTRDEAYSNLRVVRFLGHSVRIHYKIVDALAAVNERILEEARADRTVQTWINNLAIPETWSWRNIAATQSRSLHSYGIALDLLPRSLGRLQTYWLWTSQYRVDWYNVPYEERYHPPDAVIKAFEAYGFTWGGKWQQFDTMHFEYRPDILILSDMSFTHILPEED